jgi:hypothetical protein
MLDQLTTLPQALQDVLQHVRNFWRQDGEMVDKDAVVVKLADGEEVKGKFIECDLSSAPVGNCAGMLKSMVAHLDEFDPKSPNTMEVLGTEFNMIVQKAKLMGCEEGYAFVVILILLVV